MDGKVNRGYSQRLQTPSSMRNQSPEPRPSRCRERSDEDVRRSRSRRSRSRHSRGRPSRATWSRSPVLPVGILNQRLRASCTPPRGRLDVVERRSRTRILTVTRLRSPSCHTRNRCSHSRSPAASQQHRSKTRYLSDKERRSTSHLQSRRRSRSRSPIRWNEQERRSRSRTRRSQHSRGQQHETTQDENSGKSNLLNSNVNNNMNVNLTELLSFMKTLVKPDQFPKLHYDKNMIPEFDPTIKNHRIDNWISKINECAKIYNWTEQQTAHFALPRLVGHAKKWYEGLQSINKTWSEWQECLRRAFPSEANYGVLLTEMLDKRYKPGESLDEYYYEKMVLLNACDIKEKKAVDCIIHGLDDRTLKASASSARFSQPEDLLGFLKDMCRESTSKPKQSYQANNSITCSNCKKVGHTFRQCRATVCYNCKQYGHKLQNCSLPLNKCNTCQKLGHKSEDCYRNKQSSDKTTTAKPNIPNLEKRTMVAETSMTMSNSKFYKLAHINGSNSISCFIDFGSDCSIISKDLVDEYGLNLDKSHMPIIKGVGESHISPIGKTKFRLKIGDVEAFILAYVVLPEQLHVPLLVGQNFTELSHVLVIKTNKSLELINRKITSELPSIEHESNNVIKLYTDTESQVEKSGVICCFTKDMLNGTIFIPGSYRQYSGIEYWIQEGVYQVENSKTSVLIITPSTLNLKKNVLLIRAEKLSDAIQTVAECFHTQTQYEPINRSDISINNELPNQEKEQVYNLIKAYRSTFAQNLSELGCTDLGEMDIQLTDKTPVVYRPYRLSLKERETVQNMVNELMANDIVEESASSYASPILLVPKKTGGQPRLCVDYRALNSKTVKDHFPLPRIEDQIDLLSGSKYFSSLDLTSGYYQIPIRPDCRNLTAFITPNGLYQFKRMPFGLVNAPAIFQRTITKALNLKTSKVDPKNELGKPALAYMDDLIIPSKTFSDGYQKLEKTFELLNLSKLTLNLKKCHFFKNKIDYLGYEINSEGVRPGTAKIEAVENFPCPKNVHEVRQFVGLSSYFRRFIKNFSIIARPLTDLTKKDVSWNWGSEEQRAFCTLKEKLIQRPVLALFNPNYITELHTDASKAGLAGILLQKENDSSPLNPISYFSRKTTIDEQKFHAYDLETLAVVTSLNRFRVYLLGSQFTIVTDCNALRATFSKRDLLPRIARWWLTLQEYDCQIVYRPNHSMTHVDALSRNPIQSDDVEPELCRVLSATQNDWLLSLQLTDPKLQHIRDVLEDPKYNELVDIKQNFVVKENKLFRKVGENELKWVVPKGARWQICRQNHDDIGHFSVEKTLSKIKKDFWFPKMKKFIKKYVKSCVNCAYSKDLSGKKEGYLHPIPKSDVPFDTVHIDHLGPFVRSKQGNMYLLLIVDGFTKFCIIKPLRNLKASPTIKALIDAFSMFGFPARLISDRGSTFTSQEFEKFCESSHIKHILNAVASPRANGQVERYNRTVLDALSSYSDKLGESKWDQELGKVQWGLNNTLNKGIGKTPSEALFGKTLSHGGENVFGEVFVETRKTSQNLDEIRTEISDYITKDQEQQKLRFDKNRKAPKVYMIGDLVKIKKQINRNDGQSKKLLPTFSGPYRITKILDNDRYEVSSIPGSNLGNKKYSNIWAVDQIQPWINTHVNTYSSESGTETE